MSIKNHYNFIQKLGLSLLFFLSPPIVSAQNNAPPANLQNLNVVFGIGISSVIGLIALVSFGMLVYGGYIYLSAGADKNAASKAWQTITLSIFGLIITLSAWVILKLMGAFLGVDLTFFDVCITPGCN